MVHTPENGRCPDCQVEPFELHEAGCDVARCKEHGIQWLQHSDCALTHWAGYWPGDFEVLEYQLPDLNAVGWPSGMTWSPQLERFVMP
jgi:hypothetical protein